MLKRDLKQAFYSGVLTVLNNKLIIALEHIVNQSETVSWAGYAANVKEYNRLEILVDLAKTRGKL